MIRTPKCNGFSLIEVLVAAFILFMVVSVVSNVFYSTVKGKINAENYLNLGSFPEMLAEHVRLSVQEGENAGKGVLLNMKYQWNAVKQQSSRIIPFTPVTQEKGQISNVGSATLWRVTLIIEGKTRQFNYELFVTSVSAQ